MSVIPTLSKIKAQDVSGQKVVEIKNIPEDVSVHELVQDLLPRMNLPRNDTEGRPLAYHAHLERERRHLHLSEIVGDVLKEDDRIVLQPDIQAGQPLV
jgi:hypothetical protein